MHTVQSSSVGLPAPALPLDVSAAGTNNSILSPAVVQTLSQLT